MILVPTNCSSVKRATNNLLPKEIYCHITSAVTSNRTQHIFVHIVGRNTSQKAACIPTWGINTNKQDSYVNFVTSGSRTTMHLSNIWKKHDNKKDVCPRCCGLFKDVKQHALSCKITKTKAHKYGYCDKVFVEKRYLSDHIDKKHLKPKLHVCKCGKNYSYVYALPRHESLVTPPV